MLHLWIQKIWKGPAQTCSAVFQEAMKVTPTLQEPTERAEINSTNLWETMVHLRWTTRPHCHICHLEKKNMAPWSPFSSLPRLRHDDWRHHDLRQRLSLHCQLPAHEPAHRNWPTEPQDHMTRGSLLQNTCCQSGERSQERQVRSPGTTGWIV